MFMQSNVGAYEVRRDSQTNEVSIVPITQEEYSNRSRIHTSEEYDEFMLDIISNLTHDINTIFSVHRVLNVLNNNINQ